MTEFSEIDLRAFLLGRLHQEVAVEIEERSLVDEAFFDEIEEAEDELIDDYLLGSLSPEETNYFAQRSRSWPGINERLRVRKALLGALKQTGQKTLVSQSARQSARPERSVRKFLIPVFGLTACILIALALQWHHHPAPQITKTEPARPLPHSGSSLPAEPTTEEALGPEIVFFPQHVSRGAEQVSPQILRAGISHRATLQLELPAWAQANDRKWDVTVAGVHGVVHVERGLQTQKTGDIFFVATTFDPSAIAPGQYSVTLSQPQTRHSIHEWELRVTK